MLMFNPIKVGQNILQAKRQYDEIQKKLRLVQVIGKSSKDLVKVTINGLREIVDVEVSDEVLSDKVVLQKSIKEAFNDAVKKLEKEVANTLSKDDAMDLFKKLMN